MKKQGKDVEILRKEIIEPLISKKILAERYLDHSLQGNYKNCRECHIRADWLLIYEVVEDILILRRTGSHAELFG